MAKEVVRVLCLSCGAHDCGKRERSSYPKAAIAIGTETM
jgi:hypothetical protein